MIDSLGEGVNFLIVSDHGFNPRPLAFYPNAWLHAAGDASEEVLRTISPHEDGPRPVRRPPPLAASGHDEEVSGGATVIRTIDAVDLERSRAFVPGTDGVIVVKSKEDERSIISGLPALKDDSGKEICKVYTRDQVYKGDRLDAAPQLLIVPRDDINIKTDPFSRSIVSSVGELPKGEPRAERHLPRHRPGHQEVGNAGRLLGGRGSHLAYIDGHTAPRRDGRARNPGDHA